MESNIKQLISCEIHFPKNFANSTTKDYGILFYNKDNPTSHDSNHAIITRLDINVRDTLKDIAAFYESLGISPRIYPAYLSEELEILRPVFNDVGFEFSEWKDTEFFIYTNSSNIDINKELVIKRVKEIDSGIIEIIHTDDDSDRLIKVLHKHIQWENFHLLVGYIGDKAVTMVSVNLMDGFSRVDDMLTHENYRSRGYGRTIVHSLAAYHSGISQNQIYLYASNPVAIRMYQAVGFTKIDYYFKSWSAWQNK